LDKIKWDHLCNKFQRSWWLLFI